jgi:hypothetical protein
MDIEGGKGKNQSHLLIIIFMVHIEESIYNADYLVLSLHRANVTRSFDPLTITLLTIHLTSKNPIHPRSVNSVTWAWNIYLPGISYWNSSIPLSP